jgi:hypothetical protein
MDEHLYIVIYRHPGEKWREKTAGVFESRRLAENYIECCKATGFNGQLAWVEGPICTPESMAEAEARLGDF